MNNEKTNKGIITKNMDKNVNPRNDFFKYVNGSWIKNAIIPKDKSAWGPLQILIVIVGTPLILHFWPF